jgi:hypothetical protein
MPAPTIDPMTIAVSEESGIFCASDELIASLPFVSTTPQMIEWFSLPTACDSAMTKAEREPGSSPKKTRDARVEIGLGFGEGLETRANMPTRREKGLIATAKVLGSEKIPAPIIKRMTSADNDTGTTCSAMKPP